MSRDMRAWAEKNIQPEKIRIVAEHVKRLIDGGTVTEDRVMDHTIHHIPKPILVCEHPDELGDEIVDGNHTYVATALSWASAVEQGLLSPSVTPFVVGYGLRSVQWRRFLVSAPSCEAEDKLTKLQYMQPLTVSGNNRWQEKLAQSKTEYPSSLIGVDFSAWLPIPRCQVFDAVDFMIGDVGQDPDQPSFWIDVVHAGGFDQGVGDSRGFAAAF